MYPYTYPYPSHPHTPPPSNQAGGKPVPLPDINPATTTVLDRVNQAKAQASIPTTADNQQVVTVTLSSSSEAQVPDRTKPEITELDEADGGGEHKDSAAKGFCGVPSVTSVRLLVEMFNEYT